MCKELPKRLTQEMQSAQFAEELSRERAKLAVRMKLMSGGKIVSEKKMGTNLSLIPAYGGFFDFLHVALADAVKIMTQLFPGFNPESLCWMPWTAEDLRRAIALRRAGTMQKFITEQYDEPTLEQRLREKEVWDSILTP
ncbi:unnamed protein product [Gongylonema pulchrum]|uniref:Uncharacterized protein n=1 Tax=Gongylonema pulchrum TaxID=637853 RepID=A0A3P7N315_9BILA|nr:unnamed protein product [Gongylonema pulchrum]